MNDKGNYIKRKKKPIPPALTAQERFDRLQGMYFTGAAPKPPSRRELPLRKIRTAVARGVKIKTIADRFGVSNKVIASIAYGRESVKEKE